MALLPQDRQSQVMLLIFVAALAAAYFFWTDWAQPTAAKISAANSETDSLQVIIDKAKQDLASGTVEDLRRKVEQYQALLDLATQVLDRAARQVLLRFVDDHLQAVGLAVRRRDLRSGRLRPIGPEEVRRRERGDEDEQHDLALPVLGKQGHGLPHRLGEGDG